MFLRYFVVCFKQLKKIYKILILMDLIILMLFGLGIKYFDNNKEDTKLNIGIVANEQNLYLGFGIDLLKYVDASKDTINFVRLTEDEAKNELKKGNLQGYVLIDDEFLAGLARGENIALKYVSKNIDIGLIDNLIKEISEIISISIVESEKSIYAMQEYMEEAGLEHSQISEYTDKMNIKMFKLITSRDKLYELEKYEVYEEFDYIFYYFTASILFLALIFAINIILLYQNKNTSLAKILASNGLSEFKQVISEYLVYFIALYLQLVFLYTLIFVFVRKNLDIEYLALLIAIFIMALQVSALYYLLYEVLRDKLGFFSLGILLSLVLSYLSGVFYPSSFLPKSILAISKILVSSKVLELLRNILVANEVYGLLLVNMAYFVVFITLSIICRKLSQKENYA